MDGEISPSRSLSVNKVNPHVTDACSTTDRMSFENVVDSGLISAFHSLATSPASSFDLRSSERLGKMAGGAAMIACDLGQDVSPAARSSEMLASEM